MEEEELDSKTIKNLKDSDVVKIRTDLGEDVDMKKSENSS